MRFLLAWTSSMFTLIPMLASAFTTNAYVGGEPNLQGGYYADPRSTYIDGLSNPTFAATIMSVSTTTTFNSMVWWGGYSGGAPASDSFNIVIQSETGGSIDGRTYAAVLNSESIVTRNATGNPIAGGYSEYAYDTDFSAISLSPGTYYVSLIDHTTGTAPTQGVFFWETTSQGPQLGGASAHTVYIPNCCSAQSYSPNSAENLAFVLQYTPPLAPVPLPTSALLLLSGLGGIGVLARRRKCSDEYRRRSLSRKASAFPVKFPTMPAAARPL